MTRKDYVLIANAIKRTRELYPETEQAMGILAEELCDELHKDNPLFDETRFLNACGNLKDLADFYSTQREAL